MASPGQPAEAEDNVVQSAPPLGDSMSSNAPLPRRGPPMQGHWEGPPEDPQAFQGGQPLHSQPPHNQPLRSKEGVELPDAFEALLELCGIEGTPAEEFLNWLRVEGGPRYGLENPDQLDSMDHVEDVEGWCDDPSVRETLARLFLTIKEMKAEPHQGMPTKQHDEESIASSVPSDAPEFYEEEPVTLSKVEEVLAIEHGMREACRTLPITIASWIFFTLLIFYHGETQGSFDSANTIKKAMSAINVPAVNGSETLRELRIGTITERYDIIQWVKYGLVPTVTHPDLKHGQLRRIQEMLGKVKFSQTRGVPKKCDIPASLNNFYDGMCHPAGGTPTTFGMPPVTLLQYQFPFSPYTVGNDPKKFVAWIDIGRNLSNVNDQIDSLLDFNWLDDDTHDVSIEAMFLNQEKNVYSKLEITFQLHRGGWIQQDISVTPMRGDVHYHWAVIWLDVMWVTVMVFLCWQCALHALDEYRKGLMWWWITDFFVWIDFISILTGLGIAVYYWYLSEQVDKFNQRCNSLGVMPVQNGIEAIMTWKTRYILWNFQFDKEVQYIFDEFETVNKLIEWHRFLALCYNLIIVCRFYRGFTGQPRIAVILQTVTQIAGFMVHYMIVFLIVMFNFILTGYMLFGEQLKGWSSLGDATCSAFLMLFGRFNYNELHSVAPFNAAFWFGSFFILVVLVMSGLTTATILHHYLSVRARTGQAGESIVKQIKHLIEDICFASEYNGAQKSIPPDKLFDMISSETSQLQVRHQSRFNLDRRMRTKHDVHEAEIDPKVDEAFLQNRGMDLLQADRFLNRVKEAGHHIEMRSTPTTRLTLFTARQMTQLRFRAEHMKEKTTEKAEWSSKAVDRVDLKHAKATALAQRIRNAQKLPAGWTQHYDEDGKRYLRQEETGLTSWTLPRHLI